jgi:hypothetical protein
MVAPVLDVTLRLTAIALLLKPMGPWYARPAMLSLALLALLAPRVLRSPWTWLALSVLIAVRIAADWPLADNHIYLLAYWCLAAGLALRTPVSAVSLARSSRWLLGGAFACAVLWKAVVSADYVDGRFFRVTFLTDPRFTDAALLVGGLTAEDLAHDQQALAALPEGAERLAPETIIEPVRLRRLAGLSTWGVLGLEAMVALAMLLPLGPFTSARHALLLAFCGVTYTFAPVPGFGWLLIVMGLAQAGPRAIWLRTLYVAAFLFVLFSAEIPWASLLRTGV